MTKAERIKRAKIELQIGNAMKNNLREGNKMHEQNPYINVDYVQHILKVAMTLLRAGFLDVCKDPLSDEAVVMRMSWAVLDGLYEKINKQLKEGFSND